jgi:CRP-like cAMP-binding protein
MAVSSIIDAAPAAPLASRNRLVIALVAAAPELVSLIESVDLRVGEPLVEERAPLEHAYFPESAVVSLITVMRDGTAIEAAAVGNEGFVDSSLALSGVPYATRRTIAQVPGRAVRIPSADLRAALLRSPDLHGYFLKYAQALLFQSMQSGACTKLHSMSKRCARWLLMTHDRVGADTFRLTQEYLAFMLAVRRATVNAVAGALQRQGLINYQRGRITIRDRAGLEAASCECYALIRREYERQLASPASPDEWTPRTAS